MDINRSKIELSSDVVKGLALFNNENFLKNPNGQKMQEMMPSQIFSDYPT